MKLPLQPVSVACYEKSFCALHTVRISTKTHTGHFLCWRFSGSICNAMAVAGELLLSGENGFQHADKLYYCSTFRVRLVRPFEY
jgi:hypothetical protein